MSDIAVLEDEQLRGKRVKVPGSVKCALEDAGMPLKQIEQLESLLPVDDIIDVEAEEVSETGAETSDA